MKDFTRQETIALTETTSSRLAYLEAKNLVIPQKYGNSKKPTVIYTWQQILMIKAIDRFREKLSLQTTWKVLEFLRKTGIKNKHLLVIDDKTYWVEGDWRNMPTIMQEIFAPNKEICQSTIVIIPPLSNLVTEVWEAANKSKIIDYESFKIRARDKPF